MKAFPITCKRVVPLLMACVVLTFQASAQSSSDDKAAAMKSLVESQNYVFKAQQAMPMSGRTRQLTGEDYDLKITKDKVVSYLPYFGQAYTAPIDPTKGGIQFTSTNFEYKITPGKKGGWEVSVKPKDNRDVQQMSMTISSGGYATLRVISVNRQAITFNGIIAAPHKH